MCPGISLAQQSQAITEKVLRRGNLLITSGFQPSAPSQGLLGYKPWGWALHWAALANMGLRQ